MKKELDIPVPKPEDSMTKEEILQKIEKSEFKRKSRAKRVKNLFLKYQNWRGAYYNTTQFKSPCMFLERRSGDVEFYEDATAGLMEYDHSDKSKRFIILIPSMQKKFGFADRSFKGYFCHEDSPLPIGTDPTITTEQVNIIVDKSLNDIKEWKAKEIKEWSNLAWTVGLGIAIIFLAIGFVIVMWPEKAPEATVIVKDTVVATQNATVLP